MTPVKMVWRQKIPPLVDWSSASIVNYRRVLCSLCEAEMKRVILIRTINDMFLKFPGLGERRRTIEAVTTENRQRLGCDAWRRFEGVICSTWCCVSWRSWCSLSWQMYLCRSAASYKSDKTWKQTSQKSNKQFWNQTKSRGVCHCVLLLNFAKISWSRQICKNNDMYHFCSSKKCYFLN